MSGTVSFHETQFPPNISMGAVGGPRFSTSVTTTASGYEHRNINWSQARGEWDVAHGLKTSTDVDQLIAFFRARNGKAYGFRFKDWSDYQVPRWQETPGDLFAIPVLFTTKGTTATFQLQKVYTDPVAPYTRNIYKPVQGTMALFQAGAPMNEGTDFTCDYTTGIITLSSTLTATNGVAISGYLEFDTPVRFDTDDMKLTTQMVDNYSWGPIPVVETREIS